MIARLTGELIEIDGNRLVVDCAGVGYEVRLATAGLEGSPGLGDRVSIYIRQVVREDSVSLYGFDRPEERELFDLLVEVKGCGPKVSSNLLAMGYDLVCQAIAARDSRLLSKASGVGARLAERVILELHEKLPSHGPVSVGAGTRKSTPAAPADELVDALLGLGYRRAEAEECAREFPPETGEVKERIRLALRRLAK